MKKYKENVNKSETESQYSIISDKINQSIPKH